MQNTSVGEDMEKADWWLPRAEEAGVKSWEKWKVIANEYGISS